MSARISRRIRRVLVCSNFDAIQSAGLRRGRTGFDKDKSGEKLAESEEDLLEHRTDGTDAFDTLYIGCEKFPYRDAFNLSMSGVL